MPGHRNHQIFFISTLLLFLFIPYSFMSVVDYNDEKRIICIPNSTFHIDCNRCKCSPSGLSINCTNWSCATLTISHDLLLNITISCGPDKIFLYNKHKCLCCESGNCALCTSAYYEIAHNLRPRKGSVVSMKNYVDECTPGIIFKNNCDTCICEENGQESACLGIPCFIHGKLNDFDETEDSREKLCVPYSTFSIDCNQCFCSNDGYSLSCDSFPCLGVEIRDDQLLNITFNCVEGRKFRYNRHECICSLNGKWATCSLAKNDYKTSNSNSNNDKVFTIAEFTELCTPGTIFKDNCNICICGFREKAVCTRIDCEYPKIFRSTNEDSAIVVPRRDIWVQKLKNKRFCNKNFGSLYCGYLRNV